MSLTGRIRFRQSWTRRFVLQAEYTTMTASLEFHRAGGSGQHPERGNPYPVAHWRDATASDVVELTALKILPRSYPGKGGIVTMRAVGSREPFTFRGNPA